MAGYTRAQIRFYEDSNFGKSDRRFYEDRLRSGRVYTAASLVLDLAIVADGIGGESAGERAAEMTIHEIFEYAKSSAEKDIPSLLQTAIEFANAKVYLEAQSERHKLDMGSTVVAAAIHEGRLYIANVGDSRIYLVRGRSITQLTVDHTWANEMIREGTLTPEEAARHPHRDDLMRSIGYEPQVKVDLGLYLDPRSSEQQARTNQGLRLRRGDHVMLCSDGLIKKRRKEEGHFVETAEIVQILAQAPAGEAAKMLVDKALERKTDDNVSVIVAEVPGRGPGMPMPKPARAAFASILAAGLVGLAIFIPSLLKPPAIPTLPPIQISQNQVYVAQASDAVLEFVPSDNKARPVKAGEFIDFMPGTLLLTHSAETGYAFVGLPGRAELFMGPNSVVKLVSSDSSEVVIQLDQGQAVLNLRSDFPTGRRLTAFSPPGAQTWISASRMCLSYDPEHRSLQMECIEDRCGYRDQEEEYVAAGYQVDFRGTRVSQVSVGLQIQACQFVPGLVPPLTATVTFSPTMKLSTEQFVATGTAKALRAHALQLTATATATAPPTATIHPSATFTRTSTATVPPSETPAPPTSTSTDVPTEVPTDTPTVIPTLLPSDTPTDMPTLADTPTETPTTASIDTETPTETPSPVLDQTQTPAGSQGSTGAFPAIDLLGILGLIIMPGALVVRTVRLRP